MINEIKQYKNIVEVEVTDFSGNMDIMYWEGNIEDFSYKYQSLKAISFPIHGGKIIDVNRIQGFNLANPEVKNLHTKISSLSNEQQESIKIKVKQYKKNMGKYPSEQWIDNVIDSFINPHREEIEWIKKIKKGEKTQEIKFRRLSFIETLSKEELKKIENQAMEELEKQEYNVNYIKGLLLIEKNKIIDKLMKI